MPSLPLLVCMLVLAGQEFKCRAVEFQPLLIPLPEWRPQATSSEPIPAHYWEDALKHSVYLTLVRDKIDELVAQGDDRPADSDRYDLWDKIKDAYFQRLPREEPATHSNATLMARGRLIENKEKFLFVEDETKGKICKDPTCMEGVRALWSVKRTRQRDQEPGNYRYELTFSVITQIPDGTKNHQSPPARTFTVREMNPESRIENFPPSAPLHAPESKDSPRTHDGRAVWFHKNILPLRHQEGHLRSHETDRIFSSFFSNDETDVWRLPTQKNSKIGYMGLSSDSQRKLMPYNYTPYKTAHLAQYGRLPPHASVFYSQHHQSGKYNVAVSNPSPSTDLKDKSLTQSTPTHIPFLPTPLSTTLSTDKMPPKKNVNKKLQQPANITRASEVVPTYVKPRPSLMNINYVTERIRPPVYNTPPGVFAVMDKKPFKPMPPLRIQQYAKMKKPSNPLDFKPSPQVIDFELSELDPLSENAFKPVNPFANFSTNNSNQRKVIINSTLNGGSEYISKISKQNTLHQNAVDQHVNNIANISATTTGMIEQGLELMMWPKAEEIFTRTTPMESEKKTTRVTTTYATTTVKELYLTLQNNSATTPRTNVNRTVIRHTNTITTTPAPKGRQLRPLHRSKSKKHRTPFSTTTERASVNKPFSEIEPVSADTDSGTANTAHTINSTETEMATTTNLPSTNATTTGFDFTNEKDHTTLRKTTKISNRYRQSTLMKKGTSAKRNKMDNSMNKNLNTTVIAMPNQYPSRRNASNFKGHNTAAAEDVRVGEPTNFYVTTTDQAIPDQAPGTHHNTKEVIDHQNKKMNSEYAPNPEDINIEKYDDIMTLKNNGSSPYIIQEVISNITTTPLPHSDNKSKKKCKKRKHNNIKSEDVHEIMSEKKVTSTTTTESSTTVDILHEIFNALSYTDSTAVNNSSNETSTKEDYEYTEEANTDGKQDTFDSIDLGDEHDIYHNIHHKADYEGHSEEDSAETEYEDEVVKDERDSESVEERYDDSQEKDIPYDVFQLLFNETNKQLQYVE